jgi:hypothetical protein
MFALMGILRTSQIRSGLAGQSCEPDISVGDHPFAIRPQDVAEHRALRDAGHILMRDHETAQAAFWPMVRETATARSS